MGFKIQRGKGKTNKHTNNDGWTEWLSANFSAGTTPVAFKIQTKNDF